MTADGRPGPNHDTPGPLAGLRVLELADEKGQFCGKLMADLGADVIKIEPPGGQNTRSVGPFLNDIPHPDRSLYFWHYNTSKRGVTLNLETADGRDLFRRIVPTADIVLECFPPGYMESLELGYQELAGLNPGLIVCPLTPFGQTGPWRDYLTCDLAHLAAGGQMASPVRDGCSSRRLCRSRVLRGELRRRSLSARELAGRPGRVRPVDRRLRGYTRGCRSELVGGVDEPR